MDPEVYDPTRPQPWDIKYEPFKNRLRIFHAVANDRMVQLIAKEREDFATLLKHRTQELLIRAEADNELGVTQPVAEPDEQSEPGDDTDPSPRAQELEISLLEKDLIISSQEVLINEPMCFLKKSNFKHNKRVKRF